MSQVHRKTLQGCVEVPNSYGGGGGENSDYYVFKLALIIMIVFNLQDHIQASLHVPM